MVNLVVKTPLHGSNLPLTIGRVSLSEQPPIKMTWVHIGATGQDVFHAEAGVKFPAPNRATGKDGGRAIWFAPSQALWVGPPLTGQPGMVCVDQSDAWASIVLEGDGAADVLARLCPLDLRASVFKRGHTARTLLGHMSCSVTLIGKNRFDIKVFRSMAHSMVGELTHAMQHVNALRPAVATG